MLTSRAGLEPAERSAVLQLAEQVVAADGGRLKLEWGVLDHREGDHPEDLLWWDGDQLVGYLALYTWSAATAELAGMVHPGRRRRGVGRRLLEAALPLLAGRGYAAALLICPRTTGAGEAFARAVGGVPDHSEHAMLLRGEPTPGPADPSLVLRAAVDDDAEDIAWLLEKGFGHPAGDLHEQLRTEGAEHVVVEQAGEPVAYLRLTLDETPAERQGGVYGFVVDPARRDQGIGRDVLRRACHRLRERGATRIGLEVEVGNARALGLYTSLGFEPVITEDYFRLALPGVPAPGAG